MKNHKKYTVNECDETRPLKEVMQGITRIEFLKKRDIILFTESYDVIPESDYSSLPKNAGVFAIEFSPIDIVLKVYTNIRMRNI